MINIEKLKNYGFFEMDVNEQIEFLKNNDFFN